VVIEIDLSSLPKNLKSAIIDEIDGECDHQLNVKNQTKTGSGHGLPIVKDLLSNDAFTNPL
jgi:hypothetical protein